tara:strand:- start:280 stop:393 length:114 start_codon:yes stop_codon:yes gene_type:complete
MIQGQGAISLFRFLAAETAEDGKFLPANTADNSWGDS